jgi:hypothetical protein
MKKFLVLYRMDMAKMREMMTANPDMGKKGMEEWGMWMKNHMADFADHGAPVGKNTEVSAQGSMQKSNDIGGYSIIQADSMEAVSKILADNPHLKMPGATCDVAELMSMEM